MWFAKASRGLAESAYRTLLLHQKKRKILIFFFFVHRQSFKNEYTEKKGPGRF